MRSTFYGGVAGQNLYGHGRIGRCGSYGHVMLGNGYNSTKRAAHSKGRGRKQNSLNVTTNEIVSKEEAPKSSYLISGGDRKRLQ